MEMQLVLSQTTILKQFFFSKTQEQQFIVKRELKLFSRINYSPLLIRKNIEVSNTSIK